MTGKSVDKPDVDHEDPQNLHPLSVQDAIDVIGNGRVQYFAVAASTLCLMSYVVDVLGFGLVMPVATCDLELTTLKKGLLSSVPYLGLTLSSHAWGFLSDFSGRRKVILVSLSSSVVFSLAAALLPNYWIILSMRLVSGMCLSGATSAMYPFVGELLTKSSRSKLMVLIGYAMGLGMMTLTGIGYLVKTMELNLPITEDYSITPWRWQMIFALVPAVLAIVIYAFLPESPVFLNHLGDKEGVMKVLRFIHEKNGNGGTEFPITNLRQEIVHGNSKTLMVIIKSFIFGTKNLFQKPFLWPVLGSCLIQYAYFTVSGVYVLWYPEITKKLSESSGEVNLCRIFNESQRFQGTNSTINWSECSIEIPDKVFVDNLIIALSYILANTLIYFGHMRIRILHLSIISMGLSAISSLILPSLSHELFIVICFTCFLAGSGVGIGLFNVLLVEIFPAELCGMVLGLTMLIGRMATFIGANGLGLLLEDNCEAVIYGTGLLLLFSLSCLIGLPRRVNDKVEQ